MMKNLTRAEAAGFFLSHDNITILTHRRPDGDTLGSAAALCLGLQKMGKNAWVLNPTESLDNLGWLLNDITKDFADNKDTIVAVDVAAPNMLPRDFAELADRCQLRIDHHGSCTPFAGEELTLENIPFAVEPSVTESRRQGLKPSHVVGIGAGEDIVVKNGCGDEGIIIGILAHAVFAVDKEPFDPGVTYPAGIAGEIDPPWAVGRASQTGLEDGKLIFAQLRCLVEGYDVVFLTLIS